MSVAAGVARGDKREKVSASRYRNFQRPSKLSLARSCPQARRQLREGLISVRLHSGLIVCPKRRGGARRHQAAGTPC